MNRRPLLLLAGVACSQAGMRPVETGLRTVVTLSSDTGAATPPTPAPTTDPSVVLNELLASNAEGLVDEAGEHEDWVELYNPTASNVDLTDWTLADAGGDWRFPDGTVLPAGAWLLVFCDEDAGDGPLHADFKLSADGDDLSLTDPDGVRVDAVAFLAQTDDISWARLPDDAGPSWGPSTAPTPGAPNGG
jgi:hypothetical protein